MKSIHALLLFIALSALLTACGEDTPPKPATFAELCTSMESNTVVSVTGHVSLPSFLTCQEGECRVNFGDGESGIMATIRASDQPTSNMMQFPPDQYTADDLHLVLDDGTTADRYTTVSVTGRVKRPSANDCYLDVSSLRLP